MELTIEYRQCEFDEENRELTIDLEDFEESISYYAQIYLHMIPESDCRDCDDIDCDVYMFDDDSLIEVLENRGYFIGGRDFSYPNNSIRVTSAMDRILDNIDKIPIEVLEDLGNKYGL